MRKWIAVIMMALVLGACGGSSPESAIREACGFSDDASVRKVEDSVDSHGNPYEVYEAQVSSEAFYGPTSDTHFVSYYEDGRVGC